MYLKTKLMKAAAVCSYVFTGLWMVAAACCFALSNPLYWLCVVFALITLVNGFVITDIRHKMKSVRLEKKEQSRYLACLILSVLCLPAFILNCVAYFRTQEDELVVVRKNVQDAPVKTKAENVIVIQHGVAFDNPITGGIWSKNWLLLHFNKMVRAFKNVRRLYWSKNTVCVDYNYYNWFRTLGMIYPGKVVKVIPNYSSGRISEEDLSKKLNNSRKNISAKIVFARRFCDYRGTLIFANCVDRLLTGYPNLDFTFAGGGELKGELERRYANNPRVHITCFSAADSIAFHMQYDIAVVPTIFSEGTSLSLLEAMSAGCFPIATHVGGMTNILLDHYNGLLCYPDEEGVYNAIVEAITMKPDDYAAIVYSAYMTAVRAFSLERWQNRWSGFMDEVMRKYANKRIVLR